MLRMSTRRLNALVTLALMLSLVTFELSQAESNDDFSEGFITKRQATDKYCGKKLSSVLQLVCGGLFNPALTKKSGDQGMELDDYMIYGELSPFRTRVNSRTMLGKLFGAGRFRRQLRGAHDECCMKACSISEMRGYCANQD